LFRRGAPSLFSEYGIKKAVLTGDALLSIGLMHAARTGKPEIVGWLAETALKMVQGITLQNQFKHKLLSTEDYLHMNYLKSGSLFEAAGALGGIAGSNNPDDVKNLAQFGKYFGNAYQIRDDIIDAFNTHNDCSAKNDLLNGDPSLLLLYAVNSEKLSNEDKDTLLSLYQGESSDLDVDYIKHIYETTGALQISVAKMEEYASLAGKLLHSYPECDAKESLYELLDQYNHDFSSNIENMSVDFIQAQ